MPHCPTAQPDCIRQKAPSLNWRLPATPATLLLQVPKEFNVWSLDAISHDMSSYIVGLNTAVQPSTAQE